VLARNVAALDGFGNCGCGQMANQKCGISAKAMRAMHVPG
jgi:hypothetical protein